MQKANLFKKALSVLACLTLLLSYIPTFPIVTVAADRTLNVLEGSKKADPATIDWENYFGPDKMDTEFAGGVWTDKSVFADESEELPGVVLADSDNFLVALSAIASDLAIKGHASAPTDTMLVLDVSGSMVDGTYEVGTIRRNYSNYESVDGIDMSLITAMIDATNDTIDTLMNQNSNNRVGVVLYSGNTNAADAATPSTATVILPLDRYTGVNGEYLSVDTTWTTSTLYTYIRNGWFGGSWEESGEATYVASGTKVSVSVKDGLKTERGATVTDSAKQVVGGTYIQNGLYKAMNQFLDVEDTVVPEGRPQAGAERMPVLVLMSDGAPTIATTSYTNIGDSHIGDGRTTDDRITFMTQLTAAYVRGTVAEHYKETANDEQDILFLTLGLGTENSTAATNTLYPAGSTSALRTDWNSYLSTEAGENVTLSIAGERLTVRREAAVEAMNYVDRYFYASDAQGLIDSFAQIISEIELKAESYATLVEGGNADFSGYVTFEDELGEMMHVADMKGVLMSDGNGGTVLYTGKGIAESMTNGVLGTVDNPTERGDELVRTVRERIPGTNTTQAQQLVANAYADGQLYYVDDNNWSNYIGWYADENGNYAGFWDKDSGYENAPAGAVYANRSYGYLGVNGESDMMHVVVLVRTELATLHQTVFFKIPASLLPTVQYRVTLNENDPTVVEEFEREDAIPMQLVFEVGLRPDINSVNLEQKIAEHLQKGGHVHRNDDGTVTFYTNEWAIGNDKNENGIPDPEEVESALVAESHFHPAMDNSRYYYTEDTPVLNADGDPVKGATRPVGEYFHQRYIYTQTERVNMMLPIAASTLANKAQYDRNTDQWFIPAGTIFSEVARFKTDKTDNATDTLSYSDFPAVFENGDKQDVYAFLGNNGAFTVEPAQGIALTKTVAEPSEEENAPTAFTFVVTLGQAVADPVITDTNGDPLTDIATVDGRQIFVTLTAGQTVVISGLPTGTTYTVEEEATDYYTASSVNANGTVEAYTIHAVDFVNTAKAFGSLVVSKDVNYPQGFVPTDAHNQKEFALEVTFTGNIEGIEASSNAVRDGNAFAVTLKDGQSAVFTNIPEGVTYTVTEGDVPDGYAFEALRYSDEAQRIDGNDTDEAHVINRYSLEPVSPNVVLVGDKTLVTNEDSWQGETFTVELFRIDNFADDEPVSTGLTAVMTEAEPHYEIDLSSIEFTSVGTYYFRAVEVIPEDRNENIAYDRTVGLFSVTVGDGDADGRLEIQAVNAYQNTIVTFDEDGWIVQKDFTNVVTTDRIYLNIQKHITDADTEEAVNVHLGDITFGLFNAMRYDNILPSYYALTNTRGEATIMIPVTKEILEENGLDGRIVYFMREIAPAVENRVVGMTYDESWMYAISIMWDEEANQATVSYAPIENGQVGAYTVYEDDAFTFEHTNVYENDVSVALELTGTKLLNDSVDLGGREFSFGLYEANADFTLGERIDSVTNDGNAITFNEVTFTAPGVYYMVAKEDPSSLGGITIDSTEYHITVVVEKFTDSDGTTRLRLADGYPLVIAYGTFDNAGADGLNFNNRYTVHGEGDVTIGGEKILNGRKPVAGEFVIGLYSDAQCEELIETTENKADGTFAFTTRTYTAADLGEDNAEVTYTYYIKEIVGDKGGVSYDPNVYTVTVTVGHEDGRLTVTASDNAVALRIVNTYEAQPVDVVLNGQKVLNGDWTSVTDKSFTFELFEADASFAITAPEPVKTATVNGASDFAITMHYDDGDEGFYYYVLKENDTAQAGGIGYDAGEYHITVNITDPGDGRLVALVTMYRPGNGNASTAVFTNTYTAEPATYTPEAQKLYEGDEMKAFDFILLVNDRFRQMVQNDENGRVVFDTLTFDTVGVYELTILEQENVLWDFVRWDTNVYTVTIHVEDDGEGHLFVNEGKTTIHDETGRGDLVFRNVHKDLITEKDVFLADDLTVSIDGEAVKKDDILTYTIEYTNYSGKMATITILDEIPEYTSYVEGSADNGGILDDGMLSWTINEVAPDATVTVSFRVKVEDTNVTVINDATVLEGENEYQTNIVTNPVPDVPTTTTTTTTTTTVPVTTVTTPTSPKTGEDGGATATASMVLFGGAAMVLLAVLGDKKRTA